MFALADSRCALAFEQRSRIEGLLLEDLLLASLEAGLLLGLADVPTLGAEAREVVVRIALD